MKSEDLRGLGLRASIHLSRRPGEAGHAAEHQASLFRQTHECSRPCTCSIRCTGIQAHTLIRRAPAARWRLRVQCTYVSTHPRAPVFPHTLQERRHALTRGHAFAVTHMHTQRTESSQVHPTPMPSLSTGTRKYTLHICVTLPTHHRCIHPGIPPPPKLQTNPAPPKCSDIPAMHGRSAPHRGPPSARL